LYVTLSHVLYRRPSSTLTDCGWIFAQHFCNRLGSSYLALKNILDESNPDHAEVLNDIKRRFREETFTREYIEQILQAHPELVCELDPLPKRTNHLNRCRSAFSTSTLPCHITQNLTVPNWCMCSPSTVRSDTDLNLAQRCPINVCKHSNR